MFETVEIPLWLLILIVLFAAVTALSHFLIPSVRWFFRRRLEKAVARLNKRLTRPIEPFKLARRHDMIQRLIYDPEVTREIVNYARENNVPENVAFEQAQTYAREIVPSFSAFAYFSFGIRVARLLVNALYTVRTGPRNEAVLAEIPPDATVIFVMNHRSNMDYVLVTYLAARASALSYAVGEWARVWPLSRLIRSMGAYFIRRKSRGALYRKVLARYVQMSTAGGVTQAIFPEGGLSLDGRLAPPKLGILAYVVDGYEPDGRDVVFVPVAINYDRILEDRVLIAADARGDRKFRARFSVVVWFVLRKLGQLLRGKFRRFGAAGVAFGQPLSLRSFGADQPVEALGDELMTRIAAAMPVMFVPVLAQVILRAEGALEDADLIAAGMSLLDQVGTDAVMLAPEARSAALEEARDRMERQGMIEMGADGWTKVPGRDRMLRYYANSIAPRLSDCNAVAE